ncbi:hypothetical protein B0A55_07049 [Friedmanniomyces simplex]|uniref:RING-type domain-containing protein n=1 Tax=Friedmanniomyces simplex TaxID=329884 RepID=A0A4U0XCQ6_9PEZI|nr:hypothetical protein B0A55_07049 [Friedmanniomyces simplex]
MGTLTGNQTRLPGQCEHKLPTSCRLTSIPSCCACADERPHTASYSTYVDGVGFVPWGTRWQRYCWYCREFWAKRVGVSGLRPALTRVPEVPEQREFLERWEEFHRGFRVVVGEGGGEERVAVLGEDWREVDPGCLPRTLEELRAGRAASEAVTQRVVQVETQEAERPGQTLEDTLDQMFQEAEGEDAAGRVHTQPARPGARSSTEVPSHSIHDMLNTAGVRDAQRDAQARPNNIHAQAMVPTVNRNREYQARRIAALRRELHRMRNGIERVISGLRDLGEAVLEHAEATNRLTALGSTLDEIGGIPSREDADLAIRSVNDLASDAATSQTDRTAASIQARVDEARQHSDEARRNRDQAASELDVADQDFRASQQRMQQLQREQRTTENYIRLFGTREEMLAQGDQYESPIGGMFSRAYQRFHAAEEVRRDERTLRRVLEDEARAGGEDEVRRLAELEARERDVWGVPLPQQVSHSSNSELRDPTQEPVGELEEYYALLRRQNWSQRPPAESPQAMLGIASVDPGDNEPYAVAQAQSTSLEGRPAPSEEFPRNMLNGWLEQTEVMAEAFQMSAEVRQRALGLTGPGRLSMLYRLQAGERRLDDVEVLQQMLRDRATLDTAARIHLASADTIDRSQAEASRQAANQQRHDAARVGDHSRQELDAQRQATRALAVAAGRTAMRTGPTALLEQMASQDAETQAAYERLRQNGWAPDGDTNEERRLRRTIYTPFGAHEYASLSDSETEQEEDDDDEDDGPQGLDATDTGRPEPKADEELKVSLECRICYTQLAEIACLPCGHLVMCKWCSEQHSPVMSHDRTRPRRAAGCPVCRKGVRQKVRVYRA